MTGVSGHHLHLGSVGGAVSGFYAAWLVVAGGVECEFADEFPAVAFQDADVEIVDQDDDLGAAISTHGLWRAGKLRHGFIRGLFH